MRPNTQKLLAWLLIALLFHRCAADKTALQIQYMQHAKAAQLRVSPSGDVVLDLRDIQGSLYYSDRPGRVAGASTPANIAMAVNHAAMQGNPANAVLSGFDLKGACNNTFVDAVVVLLNATVSYAANNQSDTGPVGVTYNIDFLDMQRNRSDAGDCLASAAMGNLSLSNPVLMIDGIGGWFDWIITGASIVGVILFAAVSILAGGPAGAAAAVEAATEVLEGADLLDGAGALVDAAPEVLEAQEAVAEQAARDAVAAGAVAGEAELDQVATEAAAAAAAGEEDMSIAEQQAFDNLRAVIRKDDAIDRKKPLPAADFTLCFSEAERAQIPTLFNWMWQHVALVSDLWSGTKTTMNEEESEEFLGFLRNSAPALAAKTDNLGSNAAARFVWLYAAMRGQC